MTAEQGQLKSPSLLEQKVATKRVFLTVGLLVATIALEFIGCEEYIFFSSNYYIVILSKHFIYCITNKL